MVPKSIKSLGYTLGAATLLSACTVGPQYKGAPDAHLNEFHNAAAVAARQTAAPTGSAVADPSVPGGGSSPGRSVAPAPALETWWSGFQDPALTRIVERALAQNLDLQAALARVDQARAAAREAGAQLLPSGEATASATHLHQSLTGPIGSIARNLPGYDRN